MSGTEIFNTAERSDMQKHRRLLIVEDDPDVRNVMGIIFRREGYEVVLASGVKEAIRACRELPFSLCICDMYLADGNGFILMQALKSCRIPAICCTGVEDSGLLEAVHVAGFCDLLQKPVDMPTLLSTVRSFVDGPGERTQPS